MARILAAIVLAIAGSISLSVGALGLGEIDLKSDLNQPFSAEISVVSEVSGELEALNVAIASVETFEQFGLERAAFLADFDFTVINNGDAGVVQITSRRPVVEPFVTLLLNVSWPQGRLLREYTVLLDPPIFATESVEAAVATPTAGPSTVTLRAEPLPARSTGTNSPRAAQVVQQPADIVRAGDAYGPVQRKETLWSIAGNMLGESTSVSRNQMMLAIYRVNPEAFAGNINRLKAGMILRVPTADDVALSISAAKAEVQRQNTEWQSDAGRDESLGGRLRLVPPADRDSEVAPGVQVDAGNGRSVTGDDRVELQGRVSQLESELVESQRQLQVRDQELQALQQQLADISRQFDAASLSGEPEPGSQSDIPAVALAEPSGDGIDVPSLAEDTPAEQQAVLAGDQAATPVDVTPAPIEREDESFLGGLLTNPLVYISLAIVLLLAWLITRNRSKSSESLRSQWEDLEEDFSADVQADVQSESTRHLEAQPQGDEAFVVEEGLPGETGDEDTNETFAGEPSEEWGGLTEEDETPLERTISTDSAVNLDQADPIAEADFHMAYGLYDQAADLLTQALQSKPQRNDLRVKLLEVYFFWENREGFMREAAALHQQIDDAADPDWNKVLILGKQICPDEVLFAGEAAVIGTTDSDDLDFNDGRGSEAIDIVFEDDSAGSVDLDLDLGGDDQAGGSDLLDFAFGAEDEGNNQEMMSGEAPTLEALTMDSADADSTIETPTMESPVMDDSFDGASTVETPTLESPVINDLSDSSSELLHGSPEEDAPTNSGSADEIKLEDLDIDLELSDLDDVDGGGSEFAADTLEFVASKLDQQFDESFDVDSGEVGSPDELAVDESDAIENLAEPQAGDTVEQPEFNVHQDTAEQPAFKAVEDKFVDDIGAPSSDESLTDQVEGSDGVIGSVTMTEVDTKLDLAQAYIDMGDPDNASSILEEVLDEAEEEQRQKAQKLLDDLAH
ncbi:MAG: FimV/HubP family polar landmark protein [Gammaproteobacteria bacterium]|jgi:pilus assembly protein FimV|nr:FimV/HubP family polar landmark protein [Gammaproteobacteria bacterium]